MATRIIEYGGQSAANGFPVIPSEQFVLKQTSMTATGTSAQSSAFNAATKLIHVITNEAISLEFGTNPTATDDSECLRAATDGWYKIPPNQSYKVAIKTTAV